jgi:GTPase
MANVLAIVGRPNVGKSTFFNRLIEARKAIMDDQSGVTRDRHYGFGDWTGKYFTIIDTGGYVTNSDDIFEAAIRDQVALAMEEATVILFMVDTETGITDLDREFAQIVRKSNKPLFIIANKAETDERRMTASEFYELGLDAEIFPVSSQTGSGTGELLDAVIAHFPTEGIEDPEGGIPRIAIIGRPNVGKSSYLNVLTGKDRSIVTDIAGTTRDSIHTRYKAFGKDFILIDTAGLRRKSRVSDDIEFYSILRSNKAIEESDVCLVMLDASRGLEAQDLNIIGLAHRAKKGIVIMVNKWDLIEKDSKTADKLKKEMLERMAPMDYMPILFASVHEKQRIFQVMEKAMEVYEAKTRKITTSKLNEVMQKEIEKYPPPAYRGKHINIKYMIQLPTPSPSFVFFCSHPKQVIESYKRFLENRLRDNFSFEGVPITLFFREK